MRTHSLGRVAYDAYRRAVGAKSITGAPLPTFRELMADESKATIVRAWEEAGIAVGGAVILWMAEQRKKERPAPEASP